MKKIILILIAAQLFLACEKMSVKNSSDNSANNMDPIVGVWRVSKYISSQTETAAIEKHIQCFSKKQVDYLKKLDKHIIFHQDNTGYDVNLNPNGNGQIIVSVKWKVLPKTIYNVTILKGVNGSEAITFMAELQSNKTELKIEDSKKNEIDGCQGNKIKIQGSILQYLSKEK